MKYNNKILVILVGFLLISNLVLLFFLFWGRKDNDRRPTGDRSRYMAMSLKKEVGFSDAQLSRFDIMRTAHMNEMKPLLDSMRSAKQNLFNYINQPEDSMTQFWAGQIGYYQSKLDLKMLHHLEDVRQLCTTDQLSRYDSLAVKVTRRLTNFRRGNEGRK